MTTEATRLIRYLRTKGFNSPQETAHDCGLDEVGLAAVLDEIEAERGYHVQQGIRRDSYGREVLWLTVRH